MMDARLSPHPTLDTAISRPRKRWRYRLAGALTALLVILLWLPPALPGFLDRIYYRGPVSDHFDGERFFNPEGEFGTGGSQRRPSPGRFLKYAMDGKRAVWPDHVPVAPPVPVPRIIGRQRSEKRRVGEEGVRPCRSG